MQKRILQELSNIEQTRQVTILYACQSGSRAWGFESTNSDYDIRFIYAHNTDWYLAFNVENRKDVINFVVDDLDIEGWDIRKVFKLFYSSNPQLMEWLHSPIVYLETDSVIDELSKLSIDFFSVKNASYHYYHMAENNFRKYLNKPEGDIWIKKYFYVIRPILCVDWLQTYETIPPVIFTELLHLLPEYLHPSMNLLLEQKLAGEEMRYGPRYDNLHEWITLKLSMGGKYSGNKHHGDIDELSKLFIETIRNF